MPIRTPRQFPRAGDEAIAVDREVAVAIALALSDGETPNAFLRHMLGLPNNPTGRETNKFRRNMLARYPTVVKELTDIHDD